MSRRRGSVAADDGAIAILVAVLAIVLFGFGAIVVDLGLARQTRHDAQDSADAASLAGADALFPTPDSNPDFAASLAAVRSSASANFNAPTRLSAWTCPSPDLPGSGIVWDGGRRSGTQCVQFGRTGLRAATSLLYVGMPTRRVDALFGGLFGARGYDISADAVAGTQTTSLPNCGVCVFGTMSLGNGATARLTGGSSLSVGSADLPLTPGPPAAVTVVEGQVTVAGTPVTPDNRFDPPDLVTNWPVANPLLGSPRPVPGRFTTTDPVTCDGEGGRLRSGTYADLDVTGRCRLRGTYVFTGTLTIEAGASLDADSATLVFDGTSTFVNKAGAVRIGHARQSNFSIYWASFQSFDVVGPSLSFGGDVWARDVPMNLSSPRVTVNGALVAGSLALNDSVQLDVTADADSTRVRHSDLALVQ